MRLRSIALAGAAALALSVPAAASDATGWYLGIGAGYDMPSKVTAEFTGTVPVTGQAGFSNTGLYIATFGYRFDSHFRIENEVGLTWRDVETTGTGSALGNITGGHSHEYSDFVNGL